ncbi:hypothetical protein K431DRAFT_75434 [Polychaeton citri CBS 116435]|uniref:Uncharacterized protein n=1 Tax=Polychaeton citri CBS 116435 TaxID=1314669 RepID=A0A9P4UPX0_9PEZI|nr:hypothetical protein K431DRAFT_75434 [Polychaeton citri CBS 116435]
MDSFAFRKRAFWRLQAPSRSRQRPTQAWKRELAIIRALSSLACLLRVLYMCVV